MKRLSMIIGLVLLILSGCSKTVTGDEKVAEEYVKSQGYKIISFNGQIQKYTLDKSKLYGSVEASSFRQQWSVQKTEPDNYFGKEVTIYGFTVKNHPLEKTFKTRTNVYIMLCEGKVVGGYSFPSANPPVSGWLYSVDGKTLEEVTGMTYAEWSENWKKKYGN